MKKSFGALCAVQYVFDTLRDALNFPKEEFG
jgi:hypothetical protein